MWRFDGRTLKVFELQDDGKYRPRDTSLAFPPLAMPKIEEALQRIGNEHETTLVAAFEDWVIEQAKNRPAR